MSNLNQLCLPSAQTESSPKFSKLMSYLYIQVRSFSLSLKNQALTNSRTFKVSQKAVDRLDLKPGNMIGPFGTDPGGDPQDRPGAFSPSSFTLFGRAHPLAIIRDLYMSASRDSPLFQLHSDISIAAWTPWTLSAICISKRYAAIRSTSVSERSSSPKTTKSIFFQLRPHTTRGHSETETGIALRVPR